MEEYNAWPSGIRDTTEFPNVDVKFDVSLREHLEAFCKMDGLGWNDYEDQRNRGNIAVADSRLRTFRKLYEKLGLIYRDNNVIRLSRLGKQLSELEIDLEREKERILDQLRKTAIEILSRYQLKNPVDEPGLPDSCDILPCICIWKAMRALGNKIHYEEMNRVILHIMKMDDLDAAIERIKKARESYDASGSISDKLEQPEELLGEPVHTNQVSARIAPWFSFAGWGGLIIEIHPDSNGYRRLKPESLAMIDEILENPPVYYPARDKEDWLHYYIGDAALNDSLTDGEAETDEHHDDEAGERVYGGRNVLFYGVPGAGKSHEIDSMIVQERSERVVFHPDYTYSDFVGQILPRVINGQLQYKFVPGPFTKMLKKAYGDPGNMYFLVIEEINRGNAPAVFGDIFQLLDRNDDGSGKYHISNYDMATVVFEDEEQIIKMPANLTLLATMNTSDQNVFTLDTAFQRRWEMHLIVNDVSKAEHAETEIEGSLISWGKFATVTNEEIIRFGEETGGAEDKRLGAYFVKTGELKRDKFPEKVLKYLWDDAFKMDHYMYFNEEISSLDTIMEMFRNESSETDILKRVLKYAVYEKMAETDITSDTKSPSDEEEQGG